MREVSVYASCAYLLPGTQSNGSLSFSTSACVPLLLETSRKSAKAAKKVSYGVSSEFSDAATFYGGDSALADVTFAGEKAKAKRLAAKSANSDAKDATGKTGGSSAVCPVAYLSHDVFGKSNPLPGKLTVGQLYWKLLSMGDEADALRLSIRYGLSAGIWD